MLENRKVERITELDSLRGIAALCVVLFHYTHKYFVFFRSKSTDLIDFKYGHFGVPLFFIISGFVIFMTINKVKTPAEFVYKRFIRLYPTFWICLIITFLGVRFLGTLPSLIVSWRDATLNLTMFYRVFRVFTDIKDVDGAYWSLLPELQFYFLIFIVFLFKQIDKIKVICLVWLLGVIVDTFFFQIKYLGLLVDFTFGGFFIAGILFYKIKINKEENILNHLFIFFTMIVNVMVYNKIGHEGSTVAIVLVYALFYLFVYNMLNFLNNKILFFLGTISYPLYLIHQNLGYCMIKQFEIFGFSGIYIIVFLVLFFIGVATIITFYIEKPLSNILNAKLKHFFIKPNL